MSKLKNILKGNVSNLIPENINITLSEIQDPVSFGEQLKSNKTKTLANLVVLEAVVTVADRIRNEIDLIISQKINLEVSHKDKLLDLSLKKDKKIISEEEYNRAVANEEINYRKAKEAYNREQETLNKRLLDILTDPYKKIKNKAETLRKNVKNREKLSKRRDQLSDKERKRILRESLKKTIIPIVTLAATELLIRIVSQNKRLSDLVDKTNDFIIAADTPEEINQARILRDSVLKEINKVERDIIKLSTQIAKIRVYITIFEAIIRVISLIPIPTAVPPGIGLPLSVITKLQKILDTALKIVSGLSYLLSIFSAVLQEALYDLEQIKLRLMDINQLIDAKTVISLDNQELTAAINSILQTNNIKNNTFPEYKGFIFNIKEEQNPNFIVKGNKRHYAVAVDSDGVEVLKSDYSFTLEPQVLVDQLKLVIDERNLEG